MSAALAFPAILESAAAVAEAALPLQRPKPIGGMVFYRKHTAALLRRYLRVSMEIGRTPCVLGNLVFRGRVSSYPMRSFEDSLIFVLDVEKCLKRLERVLQETVAHVILEDFTLAEAAALTGESLRSMNRMHGESLDRLTRMFLDCGLLNPNEENGSAD